MKKNKIDANIQREELLPSEKAFAYRMKLEAMMDLTGRKGNHSNHIFLCKMECGHRFPWENL